MSDEQQRIREHPAYPELLARYRAARHQWARGSLAFHEAARTHGISERTYCDRAVSALSAISWASDGTHDSFIDRRHLDLAFEEAEPTARDAPDPARPAGGE